MSSFLREDLRKLDQLDRQTLFLGANHIESLEDMDAYRREAAKQIDDLKAERENLRNRLKRTLRSGDEGAVIEVKKRIADVSDKIKGFKVSLKICDSVEQRAAAIREELQTLYELQEERKENANELFGRRSGTGRENVTQRY